MVNTCPIIISFMGTIMMLATWLSLSLDPNETYLTSKYWIGFPMSVRIMMVIFQIIAIIGLLMFLIPLLVTPPEEGLLADQESFSILLGLFFVFYSLWAVFIKKGFRKNKIYSALSILSLIVASICSIMFVIGSIQNNSECYITIGAFLLAFQVLISDTIVWNAKFIMNKFFIN